MTKSELPNFKEPRIILILTTVVLLSILLFYCVASLVTSIGYEAFAEAKQYAAAVGAAGKSPVTIVLDAGHGGEDPGAVDNGLNEKDLNLAITMKLASFLKLSGCQVVLTRSDDRLLYQSGEESRKKYYDLYNRLKIAESCSDAVFISIHMNKFPMENCRGLQTFYSKNHADSERLAKSVQDASVLLMPDNNRTIKVDHDTIFLLKELRIPAILVECGFLSNSTDAANLSDPLYQDRLAYVLYCGISRYLEEQDVENQLCLHQLREHDSEMVWQMSGMRVLEYLGRAASRDNRAACDENSSSAAV